MSESPYQQGVEARLRSEEHKRMNAIREAENKRKEQEAADLAAKRKADLEESTRTRALDLARQKVMTDLIKKGTNSIDALWWASQSVPFSKVSDQLAVEAAHQKASVPAPVFGDATRDIQGHTVFGQTNQTGRFYPYPDQKILTEPKIKLQVSDNGNAGDYVTTPVTSSTNVLNTLPPEFRTNQFNTASMASIPQRPQSSTNAPMPTPVSPLPPRPQVQPDMMAGAMAGTPPISASIVAPALPTPPQSKPSVVPRQFKDKSGTVWSYVGSAQDPRTDTDPNNWQPAQ